MSGKKKSKVKTKSKPKQEAPELVDILDALPADGTTVPAVPTPAGIQVYIPCEHHPSTTYRVGGFCEKCYGEETKDRIMQLDAKLDEAVLTQLDDLIDRIVKSDDLVMVERFLGRIMKRFSRPDTKRIEAKLQAVHLHGPVDFGRPE